MECFPVNIHRRRIIIGMQHFGLQTVFICYFFDDLQALLLPLMRNKTHVGAYIGFLRQHIIGIRALLHRKSDRRLQHCTCLGTDRRHDRFQYRSEQPHIAEYQLHSKSGIGRQFCEHRRYLRQQLFPERGMRLHLIDKSG